MIKKTIRLALAKNYGFVGCIKNGLLIAALLCAQTDVLLANPTGSNVVRGTVNFSQPDANTLAITNSPGSIINWQDFSIANGETTNFIQQSSSSAVLNRVTSTTDVSTLFRTQDYVVCAWLS